MPCIFVDITKLSPLYEVENTPCSSHVRSYGVRGITCSHYIKLHKKAEDLSFLLDPGCVRGHVGAVDHQPDITPSQSVGEFGIVGILRSIGVARKPAEHVQQRCSNSHRMVCHLGLIHLQSTYGKSADEALNCRLPNAVEKHAQDIVDRFRRNTCRRCRLVLRRGRAISNFVVIVACHKDPMVLLGNVSFFSPFKTGCILERLPELFLRCSQAVNVGMLFLSSTSKRS